MSNCQNEVVAHKEMCRRDSWAAIVNLYFISWLFSFRAKPIAIFGNGDIINFEDYNKFKDGAQVLIPSNENGLFAEQLGPHSQCSLKEIPKFLQNFKLQYNILKMYFN